MSTKKKNTTAVIPAGIAGYTYLNAADTEYVAEGEYKTEVTGSKADFLGFMKLVKKERDAYVATLQEKHSKTHFKLAEFPWKKLEDGNFKIKAKMKAKVDMKDGTSFTQRPNVFDSMNNLVDLQNVLIRKGSTLVLGVELIPYYTALNGAGISLRLKNVQVKKLATSDMEKTVAPEGFTIDAEGFNGETYEAPEEFSENEEAEVDNSLAEDAQDFEEDLEDLTPAEPEEDDDDTDF